MGSLEYIQSVLPEHPNLSALVLFLAVKTRIEDWNGSVCAPSKYVKRLWKAFVKHTREYLEYCRIYCNGEVIDYRWNKDDYDRSYLTTYMLIRNEDNLDEEIWPVPKLLRKTNKRAKKDCFYLLRMGPL